MGRIGKDGLPFGVFSHMFFSGQVVWCFLGCFGMFCVFSGVSGVFCGLLPARGH